MIPSCWSSTQTREVFHKCSHVSVIMIYLFFTFFFVHLFTLPIEYSIRPGLSGNLTSVKSSIMSDFRDEPEWDASCSRCSSNAWWSANHNFLISLAWAEGGIDVGDLMLKIEKCCEGDRAPPTPQKSENKFRVIWPSMRKDSHCIFTLGRNCYLVYKCINFGTLSSRDQERPVLGPWTHDSVTEFLSVFRKVSINTLEDFSIQNSATYYPYES